MARGSGQRRATRAVAGIGALLCLGGCSGFFGGGSTAGGDSGNPNVARPAEPEPEILSGDTGGLLGYLDMMQQLIDGDALTRAETFNAARDNAEFLPTTTNQLRYALALSVPGHAGSDPEAAATRLRALLAAGDWMEPGERMLATVQLHQADQLTILAEASEDLNARMERAVAAAETANAERLRQALADNEALRKELENATTMLDAITSIERSISESEVQ